MKKHVLWGIFLVLLIPFVLANMYCPDEFCSNQYYQSQPILTLSTSGYPSLGGQSYSSITIDPGLYPPVIGDVDGDMYNEIITVASAQTVEIWNTLGILEEYFFTAQPIVSRPTLVNPDYYDHTGDIFRYDIAILTNTTLEVWNTSQQKYSYNYLTWSNSAAMNGLTCTDHVCWAYTQTNPTSLNIHTFSLVLGITNTSRVIYTANDRYNTVFPAYGYGQEIKSGSFTGNYGTICGRGVFSTLSILCPTFDSTGGLFHTKSLNDANPITVNRNAFGGFVLMDGLYKIVYSAHYTAAGAKQAQFIVYNTAFTQLFASGTGTSGASGGPNKEYFSSPSIGDYDKDGYSELCYFSNDSYIDINSQMANFICYPANFQTKKYYFRVNLTNINMTFPDTFFMADYNASDDYLYIGVKDGIYKITPSESYRAYASPIASTPATRFTDSTLVTALDTTYFDPVAVRWNGNPIGVYVDGTNAWIMSTIGAGSCGDDICQQSESIFTCPVDCIPDIVCGDGICSGFETIYSCPADCFVASPCLDADPSYICKASCPSQYTVVTNLSCAGVDPSYQCCAPSESLGCTIGTPQFCQRLDATCEITNYTESRYLCNYPYLFNSSTYCAVMPYDCIANGFAGCAYGACYNAVCHIDRDCNPSYPKCIQGLCVAGYSGVPCITNNDCFSQLNASLCYNGYCVNAVFNQSAPTSPATEAGAPGATGANLDNLWLLLYGGSGLWLAFIGLIVMLIFIGDLNNFMNPHGNPLMTIIVLASGIVLFTIIRLVNPWVAVTIVVVAAALFALKVFMFSKPAEG